MTKEVKMTVEGRGIVVSRGVEEGKHYDDVRSRADIQGKVRQYTLAAE